MFTEEKAGVSTRIWVRVVLLGMLFASSSAPVGPLYLLSGHGLDRGRLLIPGECRVSMERVGGSDRRRGERGHRLDVGTGKASDDNGVEGGVGIEGVQS